ncbi:protein FAR1-RELATED SEQUENCE 9-like [Salvia miltiorrhiza]|uniref:protein FAR1-RELATED SEQUENCE 9-like n=1 Tax=Salvia miltiorrhiza TaxID=226208 RepID=UPI0025ABE872|nr:protein FAR1-RELATED SEQUENCE 9-like [Salvia miltiorrhiza]
MLKKYGLEDNDWLRRMFKLKEKWALVYGRQMFCADMTTTQRSESVNSIVKRYVNYKHKFLEFFNHFQRLLEDRRYEELKADFKANTSIPSMVYPVEILKHATSIYTPEVYKKFEQEWYKSHDSSLECFDDDGFLGRYKVTPHNKIHSHIVTFDSSSGKTKSSCRKFEFARILCSHILKVFTMKNVMKISSEYIMKRWTRQAKVGFIGESNLNKFNSDPKVLQNLRYKELCGLYVQLVTKASEDEDTYRLVKDGILKMFDMVDSRLQGQELDQHGDQTSLLLNETELQTNERNTCGAKGIKSKNKTTSGKRLRGGLERGSRKKKVGRKEVQRLSSDNLEGVQGNHDIVSDLPSVPYQGVNEIQVYANIFLVKVFLLIFVIYSLQLMLALGVLPILQNMIVDTDSVGAATALYLNLSCPE